MAFWAFGVARGEKYLNNGSVVGRYQPPPLTPANEVSSMSTRPPTPCPVCKSPAPWEANPDRPFCSERCRLIDLGRWVDGSYAIPGPAADPLEVEAERQVPSAEGQGGREPWG